MDVVVVSPGVWIDEISFLFVACCGVHPVKHRIYSRPLAPLFDPLGLQEIGEVVVVSSPRSKDGA